MSNNRNYSINFATTADLTAAAAAEKAVAKVGDAATQSGDKLDAFEREMKAALDRVREKTEGMREQLRQAGQKAGQGAGEGMGQGLNLAANMHLIGQAWQIGSQIGEVLSKALTYAYDNNIENLGRDILAWFGVQSALVDQELERQKETLPAKHREIHAKVLREYKEFWDDYNDARPQTVGEWLDELAKKADIASLKIKGLTQIQSSAISAAKEDVAQDFADAKQGIELSGEPESVKARKLASAEAARRKREAELRQFERQEREAAINAELKAKEDELAAIANKEMEQQRRADAYTTAKKVADADIEGRKASGQAVTDEDARSMRAAAFNAVGRSTGFALDPEHDDADDSKALQQLKRRRLALQESLEKARIEAATKRQALAQEGENDSVNTAREEARAQRAADDKITKARRQEMEEEEKQKKIREDYDAQQRAAAAAQNAPPPQIPAPGQEQTPPESTGDLRDALGKAASNTGDSGFKMELEDLKRRLADGGSAAELKEAAALMERASADRNDTVRAMAQTMRGMVEAQASAMASIRQDMASLRATVESMKNR